MFDDFYDELEFHLSANGIISTIPSAIKEIMTEVGYNSAMSIQLIDEDKLNFIEQYAEENYRNVVDTFKEYSNTKPFKFLPGHRECIFGIREEIVKMQSRKTAKTVKTSDVNIDITVEELKSSLEEQVANYADSIGLTDMDWSGAINKFKMIKKGNVIAVCDVVCPQCTVPTGVSYGTCWKVSNVFRHLRKHVPDSANKNGGNPGKNSKLNKLNRVENSNQNENFHYETVYVTFADDANSPTI